MQLLLLISWGLTLAIFSRLVAGRTGLGTQARNVIMLGVIYFAITFTVWQFDAAGRFIKGLMVLPFLPLTAMLAANFFKSIKY
jgi:hypothetical protein